MIKFKYYIGLVEVFPLNAGTEVYNFTKKTNADVYLQKELDTELDFKYNSGSFDFKAQELLNPAEELAFIIKRLCAGAYSTYFEGIFTMSEGSFDDDRCTFSTKIRAKEYLQKDVTVNLFGTVTPLKNGANVGVFTGAGGAARNYTSAYTFDSVLLYLAKALNPKIQGVVSDFFQINPVNVSGNCLPGIANQFTKMAVCALSDIQEPIPSNPATYEPVKFSDLMDDLNVLFDVFWFIDSNYNLRIEHRIFFDGAVWLDLTLAKYQKFIKGKNKYKYNSEDYPKSELWNCVDSKQYAKITYNQISDVNKNTNEVTKSTKVIRTDYADIRYNGNNHITHGLFLFATVLSGGKYIMIESSGQNSSLTPDYLVTNIHTYQRPYLYGVFESFTVADTISYFKGGGYTAMSLAKAKKYEDVSVPFCCTDAIDIQSQVSTDKGTAYVDKAKYDVRQELLTVGLKYENNVDFSILPSDISNLDLWLRADVGVTYNPITFVISQWDDQSGNARHATPGFSTVNYDPVNLRVELIANGNLTTPAFQLFPVKRGCVFVLFDYGTATDMNFISNNDNIPGALYWDFSVQSNQLINITENRNYPMNTYFYGAVRKGLYVVNRIGNTTERYRQNSVFPLDNSVFNPNTNVGNNQPGNKPLIIGRNSWLLGAVSATAYVKEIIVYGRALTDQEILNVEFYLAKKGFYPISV